MFFFFIILFFFLWCERVVLESAPTKLQKPDQNPFHHLLSQICPSAVSIFCYAVTNAVRRNHEQFTVIYLSHMGYSRILLILKPFTSSLET